MESERTHRLLHVVLFIVVAGIRIRRLCSVDACCRAHARRSRRAGRSTELLNCLAGTTLVSGACRERSTSAMFQQVSSGQQLAWLQRRQRRCLERVLHFQPRR